MKRKKLRQSGEAYIMSTGQKAPAKIVRSCKRDHENCRFKCSYRLDTQAQQAIHQEHWSLVDEVKRVFYMNTTTCKNKAKSRRAHDANKKKLSYSYFFFVEVRKLESAKISI